MFKSIFSRRRKPLEAFTLIGIFNSKRKSNCFTACIYNTTKDKRSHFIAISINETIATFEKVNLTSEIIYFDAAERRTVICGDRTIHSYVQENQKAVTGTKEEIELTLINILFDLATPDYSKIVISSFLKFHGKTDSCLNRQQTKSKNINLHLNKRDFIKTDKLSSTDIQEFVRQVIDRVEILKSVNPKLNIDDIALFNRTTMFYEDSHCQLDCILYDVEEKDNQIFERLITWSSKLYRELLTSTEELAQIRINQMLTSKSDEIKDQSVIDVGIDIEDQLVSNRERGGMTENGRQNDDGSKLLTLFKLAEEIKRNYTL